MSRQRMIRLALVTTTNLVLLILGRVSILTAVSEGTDTVSVLQTIPTPTTGAYIGAYIGDEFATYPELADRIHAFECMTGQRMAIINRFWGMTLSGEYADFDWLYLDEHFAEGRIVMISWNSLDSKTGAPITYQEIINGEYDFMLRAAAEDAAEFGNPMFIRWSWEMNGDWNSSGGPNAFGPDGAQPWNDKDNPTLDLYRHFGEPTKADGPERFVAAWRYIHKIFSDAEADNVSWVWSPNWISGPKVDIAPWNTLEAYYPGDEYVDWIGTSIYYRDDGGNERLTFSEMFSHTLPGLSIAQFHELHPSIPVMVAEIGASEKAHEIEDKARWITSSYEIIMQDYDYIKAILWFSVRKLEGEEFIDWRVNSSQVCLNAFRNIISQPYYRAPVIIDNNYSIICETSLPLIFSP